MAKKRRTRKKKRGASLHGVPSSQKIGILPSILWGTGASVLGGITGGIGASLGVWSGPLGIALTTYGFHRNDKIGQLAIAAGVGLVVGSATANESAEGFDFKAMTERAKSYYRNLGKKYKLSKGEESETATSGLNGDEEVNYFINPYTNHKQIDMSELDRIQAEVTQMANPVNGMIGEVDPAERNF